MALKFKKSKPTRIFQDVVDQIQRAIIDGSLKPGDVLPSEMKLKEMFSTSRGTIREALRILEQKGLVDIKTGVGGGAIIKTVDTEKIAEGLDLLVQSQKVSLDDMAEFRIEVEGIVTALAAERATKNDIKRLKQLLAEGKKLFKEDGAGWEEFIRNDIQVHIAISEIARNPIFIAVLRMVHENILGFYERFSFKEKDFQRENFQGLCDIVHTIENGEINEARSLAQDHVRKCAYNLKSARKK